jgi:hypothetical protein
VRSVFKRASAYAKASKKQPLYVQKAKANNSTSYNMAVADWFGKPEVLEIDASGWTGQSGQTVQIWAQDDTQVTLVQVVIHSNGTVLEQGEAVRSEADGLLWTYITTSDVFTSPAPLLDANAFDMAGNLGAMSYQLN